MRSIYKRQSFKSLYCTFRQRYAKQQFSRNSAVSFFPIPDQDMNALNHLCLSINSDIKNDTEIAGMFGRRNASYIFFVQIGFSIIHKNVDHECRHVT